MEKKKKVAVAGRLWSLLRLALLWARKGGGLKRELMFDLRLVSDYLKSLRPGGGRSDGLHYGEREFSFDDTPAFHFKAALMRLPRLPCITPAADFDNDDDCIFFKRGKEEYCSMHGAASGEEDDEGGDDDDEGIKCQELIEVEEEQGIDSKAEKFIAQFYEQMKLQRQVSERQYNEMLHRSMS